MFVGGNLIGTIAWILGMLLTAYTWVIIIYALMSWLSPDPYNPIVRFISSLAEPFLDTIRKLLPFARIGRVDLSPIIGILLIMATQRFLVGSLQQLAFQLGGR